MGIALIGRTVTIVVGLFLTVAAHATARERHALIISGASGGPPYAAQYSQWAADLSRVLIDRMRWLPANVVVLQEGAEGPQAATGQNVRRAIDAVRARLTSGDLLLVVLIGHGTFDGVDARFNLVGPDLEAGDWAALLAGVPARLVFLNTASASFPFLARLAAPGRIVISATDSTAQRFDTLFPEFFIRALEGDAADIDKNNRVSIWEAFSAASASVRRHYQQQGQLATERALIDDDGDGIGHEGTASGADGRLASGVYLDESVAGAPATDAELVRLLQRRAALEMEVEELKVRRQFLTAAEYQIELERIMVALARVQREVRRRRGSD